MNTTSNTYWDLTEYEYEYERVDDMGYRSDVHAVFYTTQKEELPLLKLYLEENFPVDGDFPDALQEICSNHVYGYEAVYEDVKWYDSYAEVQAFDAVVGKYLELLEEKGENNKWCYEFVRVGEDLEDIEVVREGNTEDVLNVSRSINVEY